MGATTIEHMQSSIFVCVSMRTSLIHRDFYNLWCAATHDTVDLNETNNRSHWWMCGIFGQWSVVRCKTSFILMRSKRTKKKPIKSIYMDISTKWNWMKFRFLRSHLLALAIGTRGVGIFLYLAPKKIINHLFILSIKIYKWFVYSSGRIRPHLIYIFRKLCRVCVCVRTHCVYITSFQ